MPRQDPFKKITPDIPAALSKQPGAEDKRDRSWDEANRAFSFRIREVDADRLAALAEDLAVSRDALARALIELALDTVESGAVDLETHDETNTTTDRLGRFRVTTRRFVRFSWARDRNQDPGE